jgi:hypothetical protein
MRTTIAFLTGFAVLLAMLHYANVLQARDARIHTLEHQLAATETQVKELQSFVKRCVRDAH